MRYFDDGSASILHPLTSLDKDPLGSQASYLTICQGYTGIMDPQILFAK